MYLNFSIISPLQMILMRLFPTYSSCRTVWCLLWHLKTPSSCMTRSRPFLSDSFPTSITTHSAISRGKLGLSSIIFFCSTFLHILNTFFVVNCGLVVDLSDHNFIFRTFQKQVTKYFTEQKLQLDITMCFIHVLAFHPLTCLLNPL